MKKGWCDFVCGASSVGLIWLAIQSTISSTVAKYFGECPQTNFNQ